MFFFHYLFIIGDWCRSNINDGGLLAVSMNDLKNYECIIPSTIAEQRAIATILTNMDNEITSLQAKKAKYEQVKQGMMQQLLTGRIRLVEKQTEAKNYTVMDEPACYACVAEPKQ